MDRKQKLALFEGCYAAELKADKYQQTHLDALYKGEALGYQDALVTLELLSDYEEWKSQQEG
ncbi:MAG: hypothetical protein EP149_10865 [Phascolarctobacterium sp.]|nr:hypothetical protein [Phascolarctobacterium sp.]MUU08122.1 hypothetical protein [Phascolarctobacterium sp.]MUU17765.1 hypothetical protein [Phascolarctobacterium sp.]